MKRILTAVILIALSLGVFSLLSTAQKTEAENLFDEVCVSGEKGSDSTVCADTSKPGNPITGKDGLIAKVVEVFSWAIGVVSVVIITYGGYKYISSNGDPAKVNVAKETILYAVIGLVVAISARAIIVFVLNK